MAHFLSLSRGISRANTTTTRKSAALHAIEDSGETSAPAVAIGPPPLTTSLAWFPNRPCSRRMELSPPVRSHAGLRQREGKKDAAGEQAGSAGR